MQLSTGGERRAAGHAVLEAPVLVRRSLSILALACQREDAQAIGVPQIFVAKPATTFAKSASGGAVASDAADQEHHHRGRHGGADEPAKGGREGRTSGEAAIHGLQVEGGGGVHDS